MFYRTVIFVCLLLIIHPLHAKDKTLLILGDSLSAAYGIPIESGWVALLEQRLAQQDYAFTVVNASISGETTLGARTRLPSILERQQPDITIIELGGNDGLRGFTFNEIENNLTAIISLLKQSHSRILLVPMQLPPNYGQTYNQKFRKIYERLSRQDDVWLSQFILQDIAINQRLMQADGIHPVAEAQTLMLENIWPDLQAMLNQQSAQLMP